MPDLSTPDDLQRKLAAHAEEVEREAAHNADFDKYAVLGMHAELRPYLENWASYNNEQRVAISRAVCPSALSTSWRSTLLTMSKLLLAMSGALLGVDSAVGRSACYPLRRTRQVVRAANGNGL